MVVSAHEKLNRTHGIKDSVEPVRAIVVAGAASGVGKTSVAEAVTSFLAARWPTAAAKITVTHGERGCPHGGKGCNVCGSLGGDFQIITRSSIITQQGTDSARFVEAGAVPVLWTIAREEFVTAAWREMSGMMSGAACAVIESNTLAQKISPSLTLMVVDPTTSRRLWKASAEALIKSADFLILNDRGPEDKRRALLTEIEQLRESTSDIVFVKHPREINQEAAILKRLAEIGHGAVFSRTSALMSEKED